MSSRPTVLIDACVLVNFSVLDTLLRLAEPPRVFEPKWSDEIFLEASRTLQTKLGWPAHLASHLEAELREHFPDAWIRGHDHLIPHLTNDPKDRHVLAAAVHGGVETILTFNLRHFQRQHLAPFGIRAESPQRFLLGILAQERELVLLKLEQQATDRGRTLGQLMEILAVAAPDFASAVERASGGRSDR